MFTAGSIVLQEQLQRLQEELEEVRAPFPMGRSLRDLRELTPAKVLQGLADDLHQLRSALKHIEADLLAFRDIKVLKNSLRGYRVGGSDDEMDMLESLVFDALQGRPRRP